MSKLFSSHPQPPERRAASLALVARFPEREEYTISTSEFQRVKARLLRLSNSKVTTAGNIAGDDNNGTPGRPTLKRRQPTAPDGTTPDGTTAPSDQKPNDPPKLKRNTGDTSSDPSSTTQPKSTP